MSKDDMVIGNHPGNTWPLKAYIPEEGRMLTGGLECVMYIDHGHKELVVSTYKATVRSGISSQRLISHQNYNIERGQAVPLHPTGIEEIYQGDVVVYGNDCGVVVFSRKDNNWFFMYAYEVFRGRARLQWDRMQKVAMEGAPVKPVVICSIFDLCPKPSNVSDEQWAFILEQHEVATK